MAGWRCEPGLVMVSLDREPWHRIRSWSLKAGGLLDAGEARGELVRPGFGIGGPVARFLVRTGSLGGGVGLDKHHLICWVQQWVLSSI